MGRPAGRSFFSLARTCEKGRETRRELRDRKRPAEDGRTRWRASSCVLPCVRVRSSPSVSVRGYVRPCTCGRCRPFVCPSVCLSAGVSVRPCLPLRSCGRMGGPVRSSALIYAGVSVRVRPRLVRPRVRALRPRPHHAPVRTLSCVHVCGRAHYARALCAKRDPEHMDRIRRSAAPGAAPGDPDPLQAACRSMREAKSCVKRLLKKFYKMY